MDKVIATRDYIRWNIRLLVEERMEGRKRKERSSICDVYILLESEDVGSSSTFSG